MLARLHDVPWDKLEGADGSAADLPLYLERLAAPDRDEALRALDEVRRRVWRDGEVFEATPRAVPFLVELCGMSAVLVRPPLLQLLAFVITGRAAEGRSWHEAAALAVRRCLHDFLALLADADRDVRVAAACLVTGFRDRDAEADVRRALTRRCQDDPDEVVRANAVACLNVYLPNTHQEVFDLVLERDASLLVRREAAHSLAATLREDSPLLGVATLLEAILEAPTLAPLYAGVAWNRQGLVADTCWALTRLGARATAYIRHLAKLLRRADPPDALSIAEAALLIAFGEAAASRSLADLSSDHITLLRAIAETDAIWGQELPRMLAHYGLPREQAALRAFVHRS